MNRRIAANEGSEADDVRSAVDAIVSDVDSSGQASATQDVGPAKAATPLRAKGKKTGGSGSGDVGQMLRGAYRQTVEEAVPDDLMDLLNKLE